MRLIRACGYGECRILPTSMPATLRSSVYLPAPVVFSAASIIAVGLPIMEKSLMLSFRAKRGICFSVGGATLLRHHSFLFRGNRRADGFIHLAIARAAAKIAAECGPDLRLGRVGVVCQHRFDGHHESRRTEAALRSSPVAIRLLDRGQGPMLAHSLDSSDLLAFATGRKQSARHHGDAIDQHRTGAAGRIIAAALRAREFQFLPQYV